MSDDPKPITKVTINSGGTVVVVESPEDLDAVTATAQAAHREAHDRCYPPLPERLGGYL